MSEQPTPDLLPCPFCGSTILIIEGRYPYVECLKCKTTGPLSTTEPPQEQAEAVAAWNRRAIWDASGAVTLDTCIGPSEYNRLRITRVYGGVGAADHWAVERQDPLPEDGADRWTWVEVARFPCFSSYQVGGEPATPTAAGVERVLDDLGLGVKPPTKPAAARPCSNCHGTGHMGSGGCRYCWGTGEVNV